MASSGPSLHWLAGWSTWRPGVTGRLESPGNEGAEKGTESLAHRLPSLRDRAKKHQTAAELRNGTGCPALEGTSWRARAPAGSSCWGFGSPSPPSAASEVRKQFGDLILGFSTGLPCITDYLGEGSQLDRPPPSSVTVRNLPRGFGRVPHGGWVESARYYCAFCRCWFLSARELG